MPIAGIPSMTHSLFQYLSPWCITNPASLSLGDPATKGQTRFNSPIPGYNFAANVNKFCTMPVDVPRIDPPQ